MGELSKPFDLSYSLETSFGSEKSTSHKAFSNILEEKPSITLNQVKLGGSFNDYDLTEIMEQNGPQSVELSFKFPLHSSGTANSTGGEAEPEWAELLDGIFKDPTVGVDSAVEASPTPSQSGFTVGSGKGAGFAAVQGLILDDADGVDELNFTQTRSTDALTFSRNFIATPATADPVVNTATRGLIKAVADTGDALPSYTFYYNSGAYLIKMLGMSISGIKIMGNAGEFAYVELSFKGDSWSFAAAQAVAGSALTKGTLLKCMDADAYYDGTALTWSSFELDLGLVVEEIKDIAGAHGRSGYIMSDVKPVAKITTLYSSTYYTDFVGTTAKKFQMDSFGTAKGNMFGAYMPQTQISVERADFPTGLEGSNLTFRRLEADVGSYDLLIAFG